MDLYLLLKIYNDMDLGLWLLKGEERCQMSGDLRMRLEYEKIRVLEQMEVRAKRDDGNRMKNDQLSDNFK